MNLIKLENGFLQKGLHSMLKKTVYILFLGLKTVPHKNQLPYSKVYRFNVDYLIRFQSANVINKTISLSKSQPSLTPRSEKA